MRIMPVTTLLVSALTFFSNRCDAQAYPVKTFSGSAGAEALFAESKLASTHRTGAGVTLKGEYVFGGHVSATVNTGYYFMPAKTIENTNTADISAIPVKAGVRYYLGSFYGAGEVGGIFFVGNNSRGGLLYSFGMGDKFRAGRNVFDIGLRHEGWSTSENSRGIIALRVAYEFALNEKEGSRIPEL